MKIALICWVGQGALADDLIGEATKRELEALGHTVDMGPWPKSHKALVNRFNKCGAVIIGGGSWICPAKAYPMAQVEQWAPKIRASLHILGPGFRKETDLLSKSQVDLNQFMFNHAKTSWIRGLITEEEMKRNGIECAHDGFGDPGILMQVDTGGKRLQGEGPTLAMVVRNIPDAEVCNVSNALTHEFFKRLCVRWENETGGSLHFISWRHSHEGYDNDYEAAQAVVKSLPKGLKARIHRPKDAETAARLICSADVVISQRLHPTIVALSNGVKAVGLDYEFRKMEDFASVVGFKYWLDTNRFAKGSDEIDRCVTSAVYWPQEGVDYPRLFQALSDARTGLRKHMRRTFK